MSQQADLSRVSELSSVAAPSWVQGVWQRPWVRTSDGESRDHFVVWIQTPTLYADFRALQCKSSGVDGLRDEGFAGWLDVEGQTCRWARPIDLHPGPEDADQGAMFIDGDVMLETGLLRNYLEEFRRIESAERCFAASRGEFDLLDNKVRFAREGRLEILVAVGTHVTHASRDEQSALRHGRYDVQTSSVDFSQSLGELAAFTQCDEPWTIWTDDKERRDTLLAATILSA